MTKSSQTTTYDYGEDGLRLIKATPSQTTVFIDKYTELRGSDVVRHIYANDKLIASVDELNNTTYNHADHLGSSNLKTDSVGNMIKRIEYVPFGDKRTEVGSYNNIKNRFTGQYEDEESDLYYYQQRYYDSVLSRFISADPLYSEEMDKKGVNSQELNLYSYVGNNPINRTDPTGLYQLTNDGGAGMGYSGGGVMNSEAAIGMAKAYAVVGGAAIAVSAIPVAASALAPTVKGAIIAGGIEANSALIGLGMYAANKPDSVSNIVTGLTGAIDKFAFGGVGGGSAPSAPYSPYDAISTAWDFGVKVGEAIDKAINDSNSDINMGAQSTIDTSQQTDGMHLND